MSISEKTFQPKNKKVGLFAQGVHDKVFARSKLKKKDNLDLADFLAFTLLLPSFLRPTNALDDTVVVNSQNEILRVAITGNNFCPRNQLTNCLQLRYTLTAENAAVALIFNVAIYIQTIAHSNPIPNPSDIALIKKCLLPNITQVVKDNVPGIFFSGDNAQSCSWIPSFIEEILLQKGYYLRVNVQSDPISTVACYNLGSSMRNPVIHCVDLQPTPTESRSGSTSKSDTSSNVGSSSGSRPISQSNTASHSLTKEELELHTRSLLSSVTGAVSKSASAHETNSASGSRTTSQSNTVPPSPSLTRELSMSFSHNPFKESEALGNKILLIAAVFVGATLLLCCCVGAAFCYKIRKQKRKAVDVDDFGAPLSVVTTPNPLPNQPPPANHDDNVDAFGAPLTTIAPNPLINQPPPPPDNADERLQPATRPSTSSHCSAPSFQPS